MSNMMQARPKCLVLYWTELQAGWWPNIGRVCPVCRGCLEKVPPDIGPGAISCFQCGREFAEIQRGPRPANVVFTEERRGPKPKQRTCVDCGSTINGAAVRCVKCTHKFRTERALVARLKYLLTNNYARTGEELCRVLGITRNALKCGVTRARARGVSIIHRGDEYFLER